MALQNKCSSYAENVLKSLWLYKTKTIKLDKNISSGCKYIFVNDFCCCCFMEGRKEMFYLMTHSTHFIYGYMASDIWLRTILIVRKETCCRHKGYFFRLAARVLLYALSHRQDSTYHSLCYTGRGALAGTRNSSMGPPWRIDPTTHRVMSERSYHGATSRSLVALWDKNNKTMQKQKLCTLHIFVNYFFLGAL